jgi:hypothetical protein
MTKRQRPLEASGPTAKLTAQDYERRLRKLQVELVK